MTGKKSPYDGQSNHEESIKYSNSDLSTESSAGGNDPDEDDALPEGIGRYTEPYSNPRWWFAGSKFPQCFSCKHFYGRVKGKMRCKAYPKGIPAELSSNKVDHTTPYADDNDIMFEAAED